MSDSKKVVVRPAASSDMPRVGVLAGRLVQLHHGWDPLRFIHLENPAPGYERFLGGELAKDGSIVLVAEIEGAVVGYAYARLEPKNWMDLLDPCGKLHDIYVDESARGAGAGTLLVREIQARLAEKGAPRVVLLTAAKNEAAQALFKRAGFRTTMHEMTAELEPSSPETRRMAGA